MYERRDNYNRLAPVFNGNIVVLTNGRTFSGDDLFVRCMYDIDAATVVVVDGSTREAWATGRQYEAGLRS